MSAISRSRTPKPRTSAPPGTRRSAATDAVRLAPSPLPLPRLGAVAMSVTTTSLDGVCGAVCGDACVPGLGVDWRGLGVVWRARVGGWVGFEGVRFVRFVCLSRLPPVSFYRYLCGVYMYGMCECERVSV